MSEWKREFVDGVMFESLYRINQVLDHILGGAELDPEDEEALGDAADLIGPVLSKYEARGYKDE